MRIGKCACPPDLHENCETCKHAKPHYLTNECQEYVNICPDASCHPQKNPDMDNLTLDLDGCKTQVDWWDFLYHTNANRNTDKRYANKRYGASCFLVKR